jgi:hypothetical protein
MYEFNGLQLVRALLSCRTYHPLVVKGLGGRAALHFDRGLALADLSLSSMLTSFLY